MPTPLRLALKRALADGKVTAREADRITALAKENGVITVEEKNEVLRWMAPNLDRFEPAAQKKLDWLSGRQLSKADANDPAPMAGDEALQTKPIYGSLFVNGVSPNDINQGQTGDCWFLASLASVAKAHPELIKRNVVANPDGSVFVCFYHRNDKGVAEPEWIKVDRDAIHDASLQYGHATDSKELWPVLYEKAFAKYGEKHKLDPYDPDRKGYDSIGHGNSPGVAMFALLGHESDQTMVSDPAYLEQMRAALAKGLPVVAGTREDAIVDTRLMNLHAYTVLGIDKDGTVTLRNPWGQYEPKGNGKDDGVFKLPLADFQKYFAVAWSGK